MSQDKRLYASSEVWEQAMQLGQINLLRALLDFWPEGVSSALDVGCGDGKLTHVLAANTGINIVGLDSSAEALSRLLLPGTLGDATKMPFRDASFDLVLSTDTLEHIPDDTHDMAWAEMFRVASQYVLVAVPFREELLDATTQCTLCGNTYHVNWHQRNYDLADLHKRTPAGWHVQVSIICGEPWPELLPAETQLRRLGLDQWSDWDKAICPHCGELGHPPVSSMPLPSLTAAALGQQIYESLQTRRIWRSHSEILTIFGRTPAFMPPAVSRPVCVYRSSTLAEPDMQVMHENLIGYPQVARCVKAASNDGAIIQFPAYESVNSIQIWRTEGTSNLIEGSIEDVFGILHAGIMLPEGQAKATISFARKPVTGMYGLLLRTRQLDSIASVQLGQGPEVLWVTPEHGTDVAYHLFDHASSALYVQITSETWLDNSFLIPFRKVGFLALHDLFTRIESLAAVQQALLRNELAKSLKESDTVKRMMQNLQAERDALIERTHEADRLGVQVQNLQAERDALIERTHEADRLGVQVQNLQAERDALIERTHEADRLGVQVQNLQAERDALIGRAHEADRLGVQVQNLQAECNSLFDSLKEADRQAETASAEFVLKVAEMEQLIAGLRSDLHTNQETLDNIRQRTTYKFGEALRRKLRKP